MQNRLNDERENGHLLEPVDPNRYVRRQRRRLNTHQPSNPTRNDAANDNANPYRNSEGGASPSWNTVLVLTRRLERETLEMLAIPGAVTPALTRRLKSECGGRSGNRMN